MASNVCARAHTLVGGASAPQAPAKFCGFSAEFLRPLRGLLRLAEPVYFSRFSRFLSRARSAPGGIFRFRRACRRWRFFAFALFCRFGFFRAGLAALFSRFSRFLFRAAVLLPRLFLFGWLFVFFLFLFARPFRAAAVFRVCLFLRPPRFLFFLPFVVGLFSLFFASARSVGRAVSRIAPAPLVGAFCLFFYFVAHIVFFVFASAAFSPEMKYGRGGRFTATAPALVFAAAVRPPFCAFSGSARLWLWPYFTFSAFAAWRGFFVFVPSDLSLMACAARRCAALRLLCFRAFHFQQRVGVCLRYREFLILFALLVVFAVQFSFFHERHGVFFLQLVYAWQLRLEALVVA